MKTTPEARTPPTASATKNAVDKALDLLFLVGELSAGGPVHISSLLERSGFTRPTIYRHLNALQAARLVERTNDGYRLGSGVLALAANLRGNLSVRERALPRLRALANETGCTVHLGVRDGERVIYVEKIESKHPIRLASAVGQAAGMHTSGLGKAILAASERAFQQRYIDAGLERRTPASIVDAGQLWTELQHIQQAGYAVDDEENEPGVRCVAAAIFDYDRRVIASLSVSGTVQQIQHRAIPALSITVMRHAQRISEEMGCPPDQRGAGSP